MGLLLLQRYLASRLSWKLGLLVSGFVLFMMVIFTFFDYQWHLRTLWGDMEDHIAEEAWSVAALLEHQQDGDWQQLVRSLGTALDRGERRGRSHEVIITDSSGVVRGSTMPGIVGKAMVSPEIIKVLEGRSAFATGVMEHSDHLSFFGVVPFRPANSSTPWAIHVAEPLSPIEESLNQFLRQRIFFMALVAASLILLINLLVQRTIVRRLGLLARGVEQVKAGRLEVLLPDQGTDELGQIGAAFNQMISALRHSQEAVEVERRRLSLLYEVSRRLTGSRDWRDLVDRILSVTSELVGARGCSLLLVDPKTDILRLEGAIGVAADLARPLARLVGQVKTTAQCLNCGPCQARVGHDCPLLQAVVDDTVQGIVCLRLSLGDTTLGFINLFVTDPDAVASQFNDLNLVAAEVAAIVAAVQAQQRETATVAELQRALQDSANLQRSYVAALEQVARATGLSSGALMLHDDATSALEVAACHNVDHRTAIQWIPLAQQAMSDGLLYMTDFQGRTLVACPVASEECCYGAMMWRTNAATIDIPRVEWLLKATAAQIAILLHTLQLSARAETMAILRERNRLSREIHDGLIQHLGYIKLTVSRMTSWAMQNNNRKIVQELPKVRESIEEAYAEARDAITGLRLGLSPQDTLERVLSTYIESFSARYMLPVWLTVKGEAPRAAMKPRALLHLLRIVQEALTNVRRHSEATEVRVDLSSETGVLHISIRDNGKGIEDLHIAESQRGMRSMKERAEELSGHLEVRRLVPRGTEVHIAVPLEQVIEGRYTWPSSARS